MAMAEVHFVGAGSGAPDLITVRGRRLLEEADVVIYAGSLVNRELLSYTRPQCELHDSAYLHLDQVIEIMRSAVSEGKKVVRLLSLIHIYEGYEGPESKIKAER